MVRDIGYKSPTAFHTKSSPAPYVAPSAFSAGSEDSVQFTKGMDTEGSGGRGLHARPEGLDSRNSKPDASGDLGIRIIPHHQHLPGGK
jgi:hypothetical protein